MITLFRIIKFAWEDFWRNIWMTINTVIIIILTFVMVSLLIVFKDISSNVIKVVQKKVDISVSLKNSVEKKQSDEFQEYLRAINGVNEVVYISKTEALENFKEKHKDNQLVIDSLEELGENPLGSSFIIKASDISNYSYILNKINEFPNGDIIENKNFSNFQEVIYKVTNFTSKFEQVGIFLSIIFVIISILIIFNTIRVSIYTHKNEIEIMKLVGAGNYFIKLPFIIVGIFYTIIASVITYGIFYPVVNIVNPFLMQYFEGVFDLKKYFFSSFIEIMFIELVVMLFLNFIASSVAIRRYLK